MQAAEPVGRPAQRVEVAHPLHAVAAALQQERRAHLLHQVGGVVGRRAVHAQSDRHAGAVPDRRPGNGRRRGSGCCTGNASRQRRPRPGGPSRRGRNGRRAPARPCRAASRIAPGSPAGRQPCIASQNRFSSAVSARWVCSRTPVPRGQRGGRAHQRRGHAERRARRQRDLHHRVRAPGLVVARDQAFAVGEDGVLVLHDAVRRQAAVALRPVHRAAGHGHPHAEALRGGDLDVDRDFEAGRKDVVVIGRRGAAGQQQFRQGGGRGGIQWPPASGAPRSDTARSASRTAAGPARPAWRGSASGRNGGAC